MGYFSEETITNNANEETMAPATRSGKVTGAKYINVRNQPSKDGKPLGQLQRDSIITILGETGDYYKIKYRNFPVAYAAKHLIEEV